MEKVSELKTRLSAVRTREQRVIALTGAFRVLTALVLCGLGLLLIDWVFDLPYAARLVGLGTALTVVGWVVWQHLVKPLRRLDDDEAMALRVEAQNPDLHSRLISTLQLQHAGAGGEYVGSPELLAALEEETLDMAEPLDFSRIVKTELLKRVGIMTAIVLLIQVALAVQFPGHFIALAARLRDPAAHYPTRTHIRKVDFPPYVARGDDIPVKVTADGELPERGGMLSFKLAASNSVIPVELAPVGGALFEGKLSKAIEDVELTVALGDAVSAPGHIRVLRRPEVDTSQSFVTYQAPAYTIKNLPPPPRDKLGALSAPAGARAELTLCATKPLLQARLERSDGLRLDFTRSDTAGLSWLLKDLPIDKTTSFHVLLLDTDQLTNAVPPLEYPIDPKPDQYPAIRLLRPTHDNTVTPTAKPQVVFDAHDDYNVRAIRVAYRIQHKDASALGDIKYYELPALPQGKDLVNASFTWELAGLHAAVNDQITFWLEVDDDCPDPAFRPKKRNWGDTDSATALPSQGKFWPRSGDIKLTVVSREEKTLELQAELQRLTESLEASGKSQEEVKSRIRETQDEYLNTK